MSRATSQARSMSCMRRRPPVPTSPMRISRCTPWMFTTARPFSYSWSPASTMPPTVNRFLYLTAPIRVARTSVKPRTFPRTPPPPPGQVHVVHAQAHAWDTVAHAHQPLHVVDVHHRQALVVLLVAGLEDAADGEPLHLLDRAHRRGAHVGQHQHLVADPGADPDRKLASEHDVEAAGGEVVEAALDHLLGQHRHLALSSEALRVGKECVSTCRSRWLP